MRDQCRCGLTSCTASEVFNLDQLLYVPMPQFPYLQKRHCAFYFTGLLWVPREKEEERRLSAHWLLVEASDELHFFIPTISITSASTMMGHWRGYLGHSDGHSRQKNFCLLELLGTLAFPKELMRLVIIIIQHFYSWLQNKYWFIRKQKDKTKGVSLMNLNFSERPALASVIAAHCQFQVWPFLPLWD